MATRKKPTTTESDTCNGTELADLLGVTTRRVQQLVNEGVIPKPAKRGRYQRRDCVRDYCKWLRDQVQHRDASNVTRDIREEQLRKLQLENDIADSQVVSMEEIQEAINFAGAHLARLFGSLKGRLAPQIAPHLRDGVKSGLIAGMIDDEQRRILNEFADKLEGTADTARIRRKRKAETSKAGGSVGGRRKAAS